MSAPTLIGQAPINLGPLTTTFTPPPACATAVGVAEGGLLGLGLLGGPLANTAYLGQACSRGKAVDATTCWPPASSGAESKSAPLSGWGFYSPGLHCPIGYATACSATGGSGGGSGWPVQFKLLDGETAVGCCPSGYGCANANGQTCIMVATSTTVPMVTCDSGTKSGDVASQTVPDIKASITAFSLFAPMFQINWQSSDLPETATASSQPETTAAIPSNGTNTGANNQPTVMSGTKTVHVGAASGLPTLETDGSQAAPTGVPVNTSDTAGNNSDASRKEATPGDSGMATGTKVGLGIAGGVAAVLIAVSAFFYVWRRRRSQREEQELDRLYGIKHTTSSSADLTASDEIPGWYRGHRLMTPTQPMSADPFRGGTSELEPPASPYYRPYRP
ncbi:hypothetical protein B0H63DRAFT_461 [Podospora didyma]|uniref:Uncharacterized protein n=1 Tax=Podospora didyma TaxID=330526 RepID=A0AAE0U6G9_9PEZI|nr:hypothetical protein B0H63DRAFT_461 [Podospora didyma]